MFPARTVATVTGLGGTAGSVGGMIFPVVTGLVLDHFAAGYTVIFACCPLAYLVAFGVNHLLAPQFAPLHLADA